LSSQSLPNWFYFLFSTSSPTSPPTKAECNFFFPSSVFFSNSVDPARISPFFRRQGNSLPFYNSFEFRLGAGRSSSYSPTGFPSIPLFFFPSGKPALASRFCTLPLRSMNSSSENFYVFLPEAPPSSFLFPFGCTRFLLPFFVSVSLGDASLRWSYHLISLAPSCAWFATLFSPSPFSGLFFFASKVDQSPCSPAPFLLSPSSVFGLLLAAYDPLSNYRQNCSVRFPPAPRTLLFSSSFFLRSKPPPHTSLSSTGPFTVNLFSLRSLLACLDS